MSTTVPRGAPTDERSERSDDSPVSTAAGDHGRRWSDSFRGPFVEAPLRLTTLRREARIRAILASADLLAGAGTLLVIGMIYKRGSVVAPKILLILPLVVVLARILGLYHKDEIRLRQSTLDEAPALFQLSTFFALAVWLTSHAIYGGDLSGKQVMSLLFGFFVLAIAFRLSARAVARRITAPERCLIVGGTATSARLEQALGRGTHGSVIVRSIACATARLEREAFERLSNPINLAAVLRDDPADRLILAPRQSVSDGVLPLLHTAKRLGLRITILPFLDEVIGASAQVESVGGITVLSLPRYDLSRSARLTKRALDICGALIGLICLSPLLAIVALLIKLDSRGPVIFRQIRTGRDGKQFSIRKFRSMVKDADQQKGQLLAANEAIGLFKITNDPRLTRVGRWLRKTSLDELPQLWNVLRGDMSLVGPRPLVTDEDAKVVGWSREDRLHLQPGMTGHWQVLGSSRIPLEEMVRIDCLYVANWSLWGDVKLLLRTIPYILSARGV